MRRTTPGSRHAAAWSASKVNSATGEAVPRAVAKPETRTPPTVRGECPSGHTYDIDYVPVSGERRIYCQTCDTRDWSKTFEETHPPRPCANCGKTILVIFYQPADYPFVCDISCFLELRKAGRV